MKHIVIRLSILALAAVTAGCGPSDSELALQEAHMQLRLEHDQAKVQISATKRQFDELTQAYDASKEEIKQAREQLTELAKVKQSSVAANKSIKDLRGKVNYLETQLTQRQQQLIEVEAHTANLVELQQKNKLDELNYQQQIAEKTAVITQLQGENLKLAADANTLKIEKERVQSASQGSQKTISDLQAVRVELQKQIASTNIEKSQKDQTITGLKEELQSTRKVLNGFKNEQASLARKMSLTAEQLNATRNRAAQLNNDYKTMLEKHAQLKEVDDVKQQEIAHIRTMLEATQGEVARLTGARGLYTIQKNDNLSSIASFFYRDGNQWSNIWQANQHMLPKADLIYEGMVLVIPQIQKVP